jgi:hypothetical protein
MKPQKQSKKRTQPIRVEAAWPRDDPEDLDFPYSSASSSSDEDSTQSGDEALAAELCVIIADENAAKAKRAEARKAAEAKKDAEAEKAAEAKKAAGAKKTVDAKKAARAKKAAEAKEAAEDEDTTKDDEEDDEDEDEEAAAEEERNGTGEARCACSSRTDLPPMKSPRTQGWKLCSRMSKLAYCRSELPSSELPTQRPGQASSKVLSTALRELGEKQLILIERRS